MKTTFQFFFYSVFFSFLYFGSYAQTNKINGQVIDEDGKPVYGVKVSLGEGYEMTDKDGNFVAKIGNGNEKLENIQLFKRGHALKNWEKASEAGNDILKIYTSYTEFDLLGKAYDEYGELLASSEVVLASSDPVIKATTNAKGIFSMHIPAYVRVNQSSNFIVNGRKVESDGIQFEEKGGILNLKLPVKTQKVKVFNSASEPLTNLPININRKEYTTNTEGEVSAKLGDKQDNVFGSDGFEVQEVKYLPVDQVIMLYLKETLEQPQVTEEKQDDEENKLIATSDTEDLVETYGKDFNYIINELELEKQMLIERSNQLRFEMEKVAEKMSNEQAMTELEKKALRSYMSQLEEQLIENDLAYEEAQVKTKEIIDRMKVAMMSKDSIYQATEEKLEEAVIEKEKIEKELQRDVIIFSVVACSLAAILGVTLVSGRRIRRQRNELAIVNDQLHEAQAELVKNVEEINNQNAEIKQQASDLSVLNKEVTLKNKKMTDNIRYALTVQKAILPDQDKIAQLIPDHFITYIPKDIVSGDFYWFTHVTDPKGNDKTFIAAVDCTGHGVSGAFMSLIGCTLLNDIVNQRGIYETNEILYALNVNVANQLKQKENAGNDGMDVSLCCIEKHGNGEFKVTHSGAKRPLTYFDNKEKVIRRISGDRKSVGGKRNLEYKFTKQEIILKKGDAIYLDSDGLIDQHNSQRERFGRKKLFSLIQEVAHKPMKQQKDLIEKALVSHQEGNEQRDDILIMGFRL